jgi:hypothetical protein
MDVKVGAGTITVLRFGREAKGGYMVFDTHDVPVGTSIRGRILGYEQPGSPPAPKAEFTQNKTRTPPVSAAQDNSVHIGAGATVDQNSKGDCSPNIIGGSNTVNCPMTFGSIPARVLSSEQAETLGQFAGIAPGKVRIICMQAAPDAWKLGGQIANTLQSADWIIKSQERLTQVGGTLYGVEVQWYGERATPSSPVPLPISTPWGALTVGLQKAKFDTVHATRCRSATKIQ